MPNSKTRCWTGTPCASKSKTRCAPLRRRIPMAYPKKKKRSKSVLNSMTPTGDAPSEASPDSLNETTTTSPNAKRPAEIIQIRAALWSEARVVLREFISAELTDKVDYGTIMVKGKATKPTLFKAGAEKLAGLMGYTARFKRDADTHEMLGNPKATV